MTASIFAENRELKRSITLTVSAGLSLDLKSGERFGDFSILNLLQSSATLKQARYGVHAHNCSPYPKRTLEKSGH